MPVMRVSVLYAVRFSVLCLTLAGLVTGCHTSSGRAKKDPHA
ncbi:MAG: hypothetical protein JWO94_408, partial [Verrucomicrobiaceae bacterium]|nr:hypothetical protein [Verrucomicrobiaceae bacterium]